MTISDSKLYTTPDGIQGYDSTELKDWMAKHGKLKAWERWFVGQTGAIIDGHFIVYDYDVERFLQGLPDLDLI